MLTVTDMKVFPLHKLHWSWPLGRFSLHQIAYVCLDLGVKGMLKLFSVRKYLLVLVEMFNEMNWDRPDNTNSFYNNFRAITFELFNSFHP